MADAAHGEEIARCGDYLREELRLLKNVKVFVALGQIALAGLWKELGATGPRPRFAHGQSIDLGGGKWLVLSYHPSQQNTFTGRLTQPMFDSVFERVRDLLGRKAVAKVKSSVIRVPTKDQD